MAKYIDKDALVAWAKETYLCENASMIRKVCYKQLLEHLDILEVKEADDELQGIEKKVAESYINTIDRKRIPITLKGEIKAKFKNEFNTLWQTIDCIQFANVAKHIIERLCLHFAAWGSYNLKGIGQIDKDNKKEIDIETKEVDLNEEIESYFKGFGKFPSIGIDDCIDIAKHFFELGLNASNSLTWEDIKLIWTIGDDIPAMAEEDFYKELLRRYKTQKGE